MGKLARELKIVADAMVHDVDVDDFAQQSRPSMLCVFCGSNERVEGQDFHP